MYFQHLKYPGKLHLQDLKASQLVADQVAYNSCTVAAGEVACKKMEGWRYP